jgi:hypothetical protein
MVAISVAALVLLGARAMLGQVADSADRISSAAEAADHDANAETLLRALVERLDLATGPDDVVRGTPQGARFRSWCEVPSGWLEACDVTLGVIASGDERVLAVELSTGELIRVRRGFARGELMYLRSARDGGTWAADWSGIDPPLAFGIVLDADTLVVRVGERR